MKENLKLHSRLHKRVGVFVYVIMNTNRTSLQISSEGLGYDLRRVSRGPQVVRVCDQT